MAKGAVAVHPRIFDAALAESATILREQAERFCSLAEEAEKLKQTEVSVRCDMAAFLLLQAAKNMER